MSNKQTNISFRVNKDLKMQADELFKNLGTNTSAAINMFLSQCVREQALAIRPSMLSPEPSDDLKEALKEVEEFEKGKIKSKGYHDVDLMFAKIAEETEDYD